jgi:cyanate permease
MGKKVAKVVAIVIGVIWLLATVVPLTQGNTEKAVNNFMAPINIAIGVAVSLAEFGDKLFS